MRMKKILLSIVMVLFALEAMAQVPYFAGTVGDGKLYGYTSLKVRPDINAQETYTCFQYGIGNHVAVGTDIYTGVESSYWSFLVRYGAKISPWFGIGGQVTPSFNLNNSFKYSYTTGAVYMNGQITSDGKLFWCSNTWLGLNKDADDTFTNWEYLGYTFSLKNGQSITPMLGAIHSWKFDQDVDMAAGLYYSIKNWNIYLWGNDFFKDNPRVVVGIDFAL
jgi:hypothetical protein